MTRSNSVTAAVQADLDDPSDPPGTPLPPLRHCATMPRQHSRDAATSTVSIQGSGNHYHACAADDSDGGGAGFDPSILPPPDPWMDSVAGDAPEELLPGGAGRSLCRRDGRWFLKLLQAEAERMEGWCGQMEQDEMEHELPEEGEPAGRLSLSSPRSLFLPLLFPIVSPSISLCPSTCVIVSVRQPLELLQWLLVALAVRPPLVVLQTYQS